MSSHEASTGLQKNEKSWQNREQKYWNCKVASTVRKEEARRKWSTQLAQRRIELEDQMKTDVRTAMRQQKASQLAEEYTRERQERQRRCNEPPRLGKSTSLLAKLEPIGGYQTTSTIHGPSPLMTRAPGVRLSRPYNSPKADFKEFRPPTRVYASGGGRDIWSQNSIVTNLGNNCTADYSGRNYRNSLRGNTVSPRKTVIHNDSKPWNRVLATSINPLARGCKGSGAPTATGIRCKKKTISRLSMPKYFKAKKDRHTVAPFSAGAKPSKTGFQNMGGGFACTHLY